MPINTTFLHIVKLYITDLHFFCMKLRRGVGKSEMAKVKYS